MNATDPTPTEAPVFERADLDLVLSGKTLLDHFQRFALTRFAAYTRSGNVVDERGRAVAPVEDPTARTNGGYGVWRVASNWLRVLAEADATNTDGYVPVENYVADDRGPGHVAHLVHVPYSFLFGETERSEKYAQYLALKAEFEPETVSAASGPGPEPWATPERLEAARMLATQSGGTTTWRILADPEYRESAAAAYRKAMASLMPASGSYVGPKDIRRQVHAAAITLGLTEHDLSVPERDETRR